jgi:hypothetical protein
LRKEPARVLFSPATSRLFDDLIGPQQQGTAAPPATTMNLPGSLPYTELSGNIAGREVLP